MPDIRPVSDLRNNFKEIENVIRQTNQPIFLTSNGRASMVLLSNEAYDQLMRQISGQPDPEEIKEEELKLEQILNFSRLLKNLMKANDLTAEQLSAATEIPVDTLNDFLAGELLPTDGEIEKLATPLNVSRSTLLAFVEPKEGKWNKGVQKALLKILEKIVED